MGLLSRLFKKKGNDLAEELLNKEAEKVEELLVNQQSEAVRDYKAAEELTIPGNSWGPTMPLEENQYNFPGDHVAYFTKILTEDFPTFRLEKENSKDSRATILSLWEGDALAVVVELLNKNSVRNKLRQSCLQGGIPYTRFYYDVKGWWNTRSYVKERIEKALEQVM